MNTTPNITASLFPDHASATAASLVNASPAPSGTDYKEFGHVLAFDTTYKCNAYNKPFVVLVGVNHHRNTVLFGCALVVNEKEDTYVWVLQQLIAAGDGYKPITVITDRDKAMTKAISQVLPEAKH